jgi:hypothetical protein
MRASIAPSHEGDQQLELEGGETDRDPGSPDPVGRLVHHDVAHLPHPFQAMARPAQESPHPPGQLLRVERLDHVVITTHGESRTPDTAPGIGARGHRSLTL